MTVNPQQNAVEKNLHGLGFKLQNSGKKNCSFKTELLSKDKIMHLMLSHYSMQLSPNFLIEGCISLYLQNYFSKLNIEKVGTPVPMRDLVEKVRFLANLFRNEHMQDYDNLDETNII